MPKKGTPDTPEGKVYEMLMNQSFVDWYEGEFTAHVDGDWEAKSKEEILETIKELLH